MLATNFQIQNISAINKLYLYISNSKLTCLKMFRYTCLLYHTNYWNIKFVALLYMCVAVMGQTIDGQHLRLPV